jgi:hypothetical protein
MLTQLLVQLAAGLHNLGTALNNLISFLVG